MNNPELPGFDWWCHECGRGAPLTAPFTCPACGGPMSLRTDARPGPALFAMRPKSMWHYSDLLPVRDPRRIVTMGEGATPLVDAPRLARRFGLGEVRVKNEAANPTGSFKDRQVSAGITHAVETGRDTVAVVSSGNVGVAAAAYAARAGLRAVLFMHGQAGAGKIAQASAHGAAVLRVDTPAPSEAFDLCLDACREWGWAHLSTAGMYEPWNVEGAKTIAYELYQQYEGDLPEWIVAPVGGGGLLGGVWRGFLDLHRLGLLERIPRLAGVQAAGCAPFVKAVEEGTPFLETLKRPWPNPKTVAGGIADDIIFDGHTALPAVRRTNGAAVAVDDDEIMAGALTLAKDEGLLCELTCAVVIAALRHLPGAGPNTSVCCLVTGNGLKELAFFQSKSPEPRRVAPDLKSLRAALESRA
ncbi:MAG: threonine synthase [Candidatus Hydrogenedens sp.]|nr:threonine synthase [Candidatus Hydrogenedentota bacterium]NLF56769.1 threonine synthase [Candidatus Hydrogenedens sp.]